MYTPVCARQLEIWNPGGPQLYWVQVTAGKREGVWLGPSKATLEIEGAGLQQVEWYHWTLDCSYELKTR